jgi:hypothetical protein
MWLSLLPFSFNFCPHPDMYQDFNQLILDERALFLGCVNSFAAKSLEKILIFLPLD